jgi:hypothetical protein
MLWKEQNQSSGWLSKLKFKNGGFPHLFYKTLFQNFRDGVSPVSKTFWVSLFVDRFRIT